MLPIALKLAAAFVPELIGALTKSQKAEDIAGKVVSVACDVAGVQSPEKAIDVIERDPQKVLEFQEAILKSNVELAQIDAAVLTGQFDLAKVEAKEWSSVVQSLADADRAGASTRPRIAIWMAILVCVTSGAMVLGVLVAAFTGDIAVIKALTESWEFLTIAMAVPTALLRSYFGLRTEEKRVRASVAIGSAPESPRSLLAGIVGK